MSQAHVIEVDGVFTGAAVLVGVGRLFRSVPPKLEELDSATDASFDDMRRVAMSAHRAPPAP